MKTKPALDIDALVAEAVPPRPNPQLAFTIPVRVDSETNGREHWAAKYARKQKQRQALLSEWMWRLHKSWYFAGPSYTVRLTRIGPKKLDTDNLAESFKAIRDLIANLLGIDDGSEVIKWEYEQVAVGKRVYAIRVEIY